MRARTGTVSTVTILMRTRKIRLSKGDLDVSIVMEPTSLNGENRAVINAIVVKNASMCSITTESFQE